MTISQFYFSELCHFLDLKCVETEKDAIFEGEKMDSVVAVHNRSVRLMDAIVTEHTVEFAHISNEVYYSITDTYDD
ncbi:MAG: hypothetical protein ACRCZM_11445 [Bacteroidales bacterium]